MILIACAVRGELPALPPLPQVELLVTGVGPIESAVAVSRALARGRYDCVISAGIAGAFAGCAAVGDAVIVADERMEIDLETGESIPLPNGAATVERASSDRALVDRLATRGYRSVRGLTVARVTATHATAMRRAALGVDVESMEGFAVLRAAQIAAVPAIEVRGISNIAGERAVGGWDFTAGARAADRILHELLDVLERSHH